MLIYRDHSIGRNGKRFYHKVDPRDSPCFVPAYVEHGEKLLLLNPMKLKPYTRHVPDTVRVNGNSFVFARGACDSLRQVRDTDAFAIEQIEQQIDDLGKALRQLREQAFVRGKPVRIEDAKALYSKKEIKDG